jgi:hypothetical protein
MYWNLVLHKDKNKKYVLKWNLAILEIPAIQNIPTCTIYT